MPARRPPTSRAAVRRRRAVLALAAGLALALGAAVGAAGGGDGRAGGAPGGSGRGARAADGAAPAAGALEQARSAVARMGIERQLGELVVISFSGASAPPYVQRALHDGRAAGVILFGGNVANVRALAATLQRAAGRTAAIVCLDQEGGAIRTLRFAPPAQSQSQSRTPAAARAAAAASARALRAAGVNVVLGPVADVAAGTRGSIMAPRAYPGGVAAVAASTAAAAAAYARTGVAPVLKHFPGLGGATVNTDAAPAAIRLPRAVLLAGLQPFEAPAPLVMIGHARYPALDPHAIASQSRAIATGLLRTRLGFAGVAMSDSLEARAAIRAAGGSVGTAAVRSIGAGIDLLLLTGPGSFRPVHDALLAQARRSPAFRTRVAEAATRVLALRATLPRTAG
jgi:beta-N-acetylhexosaminidase